MAALHGGEVWTYDWATLGVKCDDMDAEWVNGPWHGQWLPLEHTVVAGPEGRIMIFLQVISPLAENINGYFDDVQVWVDGEPYAGYAPTRLNAPNKQALDFVPGPACLCQRNEVYTVTQNVG